MSLCVEMSIMSVNLYETEASKLYFTEASKLYFHNVKNIP